MRERHPPEIPTPIFRICAIVSACFCQPHPRKSTAAAATHSLIAAHSGCTDEDMAELKRFTSQKLQMNPEQVQIFTPTPSTYSTLMYYTEMDPFTHEPIQVEKDLYRKERQKEIVTCKPSQRNFDSH